MNARPYAVQMQRVLSSVASRVDPAIHPLLTTREIGPDSKTLVVLVSGDKGLAGSFNTNVIKAGGAFIVESRQKVTLGLVGRKGRDFFSRRGFPVLFERTGLFQKLRFEDAREIAKAATDAFLSGEVDRVVLIYNEFRSVMSQRVVVDQLLPIARGDVDRGGEGAGASVAPVPPGGDARSQIDYLYEPSAQEIFNQLLPRYVEVQVYRALLESNAAFDSSSARHACTSTCRGISVLNSCCGVGS